MTHPRVSRLPRLRTHSAAGLLASLLLVGGCSTTSPSAQRAAPAPASEGYEKPPHVEDGWRTATPEEVGLSRAPLERMSAVIREGKRYRNVHSLLIVKQDRLVHEVYFAGEDDRRGVGPQGHVVFDRDTRHDLRSVTKSVVSALVGAAIGEGAIRSMDQPLLDFFPEHADLATPERLQISLRHALDMSAGLEWNERVSYKDPSNDEIRMNNHADPLRFVLERPVVAPPGTAWNYSGGLTQVLVAVVERATGEPLLEYAQRVLFDPLGISDVEWIEIASGAPSGASGLRLRPRDLAKFGLLYQQEGRWQGRQVLPQAWVRQTMQASLRVAGSSVEFGEEASCEGGYSLQWWPAGITLPCGRFDVLMAKGNGGQRVAVVPRLELTVVHNAGLYNSGSDFERLLLERILPWASGLDTSYELRDPRTFKLLAPGELPLVTLTDEEQGAYVGDYRFGDGPLRVFVQDMRLRAQLPWQSGDTPVDLLPLGNHEFAPGAIAGGAACKLYWPGGRFRFELVDGRAVRVLDISDAGEVYETAERIP